MNAIIEFLRGRKTYILSVIVIVYAILAYFEVVPEPDVVAAAFVVIAGYALTFRAAIAKFLEDLDIDL